jgi:hypothetical protein
MAYTAQEIIDHLRYFWQKAEGIDYGQEHEVMKAAAAQIESDAKVITALRETLEGYACYGLEKCPVPKLNDGSCIHAGTGHCGDAAFRAIEQTAGETN